MNYKITNEQLKEAGNAAWVASNDVTCAAKASYFAASNAASNDALNPDVSEIPE